MALQPGAVFYHPDHLGGVAAQTDPPGVVQAQRTFDPYGASLAEANEPFGFGGKELDSTTGLYDFGARAYDPHLGLFLSPDPAVLAKPEIAIADSQLLNPYAYARNSPTAQVDPDGRLPHILVGAGVGAAFGAGSYLVKAAFTGEFSARGLLASTAGGAVSGAVAAATGGASLLVQGAATGLAGGIAHRAIATGSVSQTLRPAALASDALWGVAGSSVARGFGPAASQVGRTSAKAGLARSSPTLVPGDPCQGVRDASAFLRAQGVPRDIRREVLQTFEQGTIRVRIAGPAEYRIRYYDGVNAAPDGRFLFQTFPAGRDSLAVKPQWNQMTSVQQWQIQPGTTMIEGRAAGQGLGLSGGQTQTYVTNPKTELMKP
jgi:RHS repeat-associated protein